MQKNAEFSVEIRNKTYEKYTQFTIFANEQLDNLHKYVNITM